MWEEEGQDNLIMLPLCCFSLILCPRSFLFNTLLCKYSRAGSRSSFATDTLAGTYKTALAKRLCSSLTESHRGLIKEQLQSSSVFASWTQRYFCASLCTQAQRHKQAPCEAWTDWTIDHNNRRCKMTEGFCFTANFWNLSSPTLTCIIKL